MAVDLDPHDFLAARHASLRAWGLSRGVLAEAGEALRSFQGTDAGAWTPVWRQLAERGAAAQRWMQAALCYGAARYGVLGLPAEAEINRLQIETFRRARFPPRLRFARRTLALGPGHSVPVHIYSEDPVRRCRAMVLLSGGLDTYKVELHLFALVLVRATHLAVAVMDMPGTGETAAPLEPHSETLYEDVLHALPGPRRRGIFGVSFGGHWAAKAALLRKVDFAVDLGGPVDARGTLAATVAEQPADMRFLIERLVGSGRTFAATPEELAEGLSLSRQGLLTPRRTPPMLVVNGADDPYVDAQDTLVFRGFPNAEVEVVPHSGHCAVERTTLVGVLTASWLVLQTQRQSLHRAAAGAALWWGRRLAE